MLLPSRVFFVSLALVSVLSFGCRNRPHDSIAFADEAEPVPGELRAKGKIKCAATLRKPQATQVLMKFEGESDVFNIPKTGPVSTDTADMKAFSPDEAPFALHVYGALNDDSVGSLRQTFLAQLEGDNDKALVQASAGGISLLTRPVDPNEGLRVAGASTLTLQDKAGVEQKVKAWVTCELFRLE